MVRGAVPTQDDFSVAPGDPYQAVFSAPIPVIGDMLPVVLRSHLHPPRD